LRRKGMGDDDPDDDEADLTIDQLRGQTPHQKPVQS